VSTPAERTEAALQYLHDVVTGDEPPDATRVAAARAIVSKDSREAGEATGAGSSRGYRVIVPAD
jgi:hypothetical protein